MPDEATATKPAEIAAPAAPAAAAPADAGKPVDKAVEKPADKPAEKAADKTDPWKDFKPPEGFTLEALKPVVEWAQKAGLDPKAAAAVALRDKQMQDAADAEFKHNSEKGWLDELTKDPELGGPKIRETMVDVMRAVDKMTPKAQAMLKEAGVLYNPIVVRILHEFGSKMKEDAFVRPGATPGTEKRAPFQDPLESLFAAKA